MNTERGYGMDQGPLSDWQGALRAVLGAYLDGAYLRVRSRWLFPFHWALSASAVQSALTDLAYAGRALVKYSDEPAVSAYLNHFDRAWAQSSIEPETSLLSALAEGYRLLDRLCQISAGKGRWEELPAGRSFDPAAYLAIDSRYYAPVVRLASYVQRQMQAYLSLALIHGSVADLAVCRGYSDLDTLLVLSRETVLDPERMRRFARLCYRSLANLYCFDPLQHHGHMVMTAIDLDHYEEHRLPLSVFAEGRYICQPAGKVRVRVQENRLAARSAFDEEVDYFRLYTRRHWAPANAYDFKYYLSILMLLPTHYLQAKGMACDKRASFALARQLLPEATWDSLDFATRLRRDWPSQRPGMVDFLGRLAGSLNVQVLRSLQRALLRRLSRLSLRDFSDQCLAQSETLAEQMFDDVYAATPGRLSLAAAPSPESDGSGQTLAITRHPVCRASKEYKQARERYVQRVRGIKGVTAVYEYGTVTRPGLSDLDFVVGVADTAEAGLAEALSVDAIPLVDRDLIMHAPIVMPNTLMETIAEFLPGSKLQALWRYDETAPMPQTGGDGKHFVFAKAAKLIEKAFSFQVWLVEARLAQALDARWAIALLKSLVYEISSTELVTGQAPAGSAAYTLAVEELRAGWFEEPSLYRRNVALRGLFDQGQRVAGQLVSHLDQFLLTSGWLNMQAMASPDGLVCAVPLSPIRVAFGQAPESASSPAQQRADDRRPLIWLPVTFLRALALYGQSAPWLAERLTVRMQSPAGKDEGEPATAFERYLVERGQRLEAQTRFLVQHRMPFGSCVTGQLFDLSKGEPDAARQRDYSDL